MLQPGERGRLRAEIVDGDADAEQTHARQDGGRGAKIKFGRGLEQFKRQRRWRRCHRVDCGCQLEKERGICRIVQRDVDRQIACKAQRVPFAKPGGRIVIVNYFHNPDRPIGKVSEMLAPYAKYIGFKPDFTLQHLLEVSKLKVEKRFPTNVFSIWDVLLIHNDK